MDLGHLCEELPTLRSVHDGSALETALAAIRSGAEVQAALVEHGLVDWSDAGIEPGGATRTPSTPPRVEGTSPVVRGHYVCPERRCARRVTAAGSDRPTCGVFDRFLDFDGGLG